MSRFTIPSNTIKNERARPLPPMVLQSHVNNNMNGMLIGLPVISDTGGFLTETIGNNTYILLSTGNTSTSAPLTFTPSTTGGTIGVANDPTFVGKVTIIDGASLDPAELIVADTSGLGLISTNNISVLNASGTATIIGVGSTGNLSAMSITTPVLDLTNGGVTTAVSTNSSGILQSVTNGTTTTYMSSTGLQTGITGTAPITVTNNGVSGVIIGISPNPTFTTATLNASSNQLTLGTGIISSSNTHTLTLPATNANANVILSSVTGSAQTINGLLYLSGNLGLQLLTGYSPSSALSIGGGEGGAGTGGFNQVEFQYANGGYRHFLQSWHDVGGITCKLRVWLNSSPNAYGSNQPGQGNNLALDINGSNLNIPYTTNQLVLGTTNTTTINSVAPSASRIYTIPDVGTNSSFILADGAQTISGVKTMSNLVLGNNSDTIPGALRYNGNFQGYNGTSFVNLDSQAVITSTSSNFTVTGGNLAISNIPYADIVPGGVAGNYYNLCLHDAYIYGNSPMVTGYDFSYGFNTTWVGPTSKPSDSGILNVIQIPFLVNATAKSVTCQISYNSANSRVWILQCVFVPGSTQSIQVSLYDTTGSPVQFSSLIAGDLVFTLNVICAY